MTFKEFFNRKDNSSLTLSMKPPGMSGMAVMQDFVKGNLPDPAAKPIPPSTLKADKPVPLTGRSRLGDRPIEKKPANFLKRAGSSTPFGVK